MVWFAPKCSMNLSVVYERVKHMSLWWIKVKDLITLLLGVLFVLILTSCSNQAISQQPSANSRESSAVATGKISEVAPPAVIQQLRQNLEIYLPQVSILTPKPGETLQDTTVTVRLQVKDLPIFKDSQLDMGPNLHVIIDNQPYIAVYDLNQPLVLSDLSPGTHTLRVFASRPWDESFKNEGAYAQTTFHVFTKSDENNPDANLPLLTYNSPKGNYGAEPILLDFYLTNAPLHLVASDRSKNQFADWRIRCTINGESFILDRWESVYLKGFKPGKNWIKLEFLDNQSNPVKNEFNSTVRLITYQPNGQDTLSKLVRGELSAEQARAIVDPSYAAKAPTTEVAPAILPQKEKQPASKVEPAPTSTVAPTPETEKAPATTDLEKSKNSFSKLFQNRASNTSVPQTTENSPPPTPQLQSEVAPEPEASELPQEQSGASKFFQSSEKPILQPTIGPASGRSSHYPGRNSSY
jgi:hypothetical protein